MVMAAWLAACGPRHVEDVVPGTKDVRVDGPKALGPDDYVHVARRPLGTVALAEARGMAPELGVAVTEHLADALDACVTELGRGGKLVAGAARLVALVGDDGAVSGVRLTTAPGDAVRANALLCVASPAKLLTFPPRVGAQDGGTPAATGTEGTRGFAVEVTWGVLEGGGRMPAGGPR